MFFFSKFIYTLIQNVFMNIKVKKYINKNINIKKVKKIRFNLLFLITKFQIFRQVSNQILLDKELTSPRGSVWC